MDLPIGGNSVVATQSPPPSDDVEAVEAMPSQVTKEHVATTQEEKSGTAAASSRFLSDVSFCGAASGEYYPMGSLEMEASESTQQSISINRLRNTPIGLGGRLDGEFLLFEMVDA